MKLKKYIIFLSLIFVWSLPLYADEAKDDNKESARAWLNGKEEEEVRSKEETPATEDQKDAERFRDMQKELDKIHSESWDERIDR